MKPDMFADPEGYAKWVRQVALEELKTEIRETIFNVSLNRARQKHKNEFTQAYAAITSLNSKNWRHRKIVQAIYNANNPGKALMKWYAEHSKSRQRAAKA